MRMMYPACNELYNYSHRSVKVSTASRHNDIEIVKQIELRMPSRKPPAPSFADVEYWDTRFTSNPAQFDWLLPPSTLEPIINEVIGQIKADSVDRRDLKALKGSGKEAQQNEEVETGEKNGGAADSGVSDGNADNIELLHIGCGSSMLSVWLRRFTHPPLVVNTDYSIKGIEVGKRMEREYLKSFKAEMGAEGEEPETSWDTLDLLNTPDILRHFHERQNKPYDLIVDKSTADAIACGVDVPITVRNPSSRPSSPSGSPQELKVQPTISLALHLAYLTHPNSRWLAISYSAERFDFLDPQEVREVDVDVDAGGEAGSDSDSTTIPETFNPARFWELEKKVTVPVPVRYNGRQEGGENGREKEKERERETVHRPEEVVYVYVMRRTEEAVNFGL